MLFLGRVKAQKQREKLGNIETQFLDELVLRRFIGGATNSLYHDSMSWERRSLSPLCHHFTPALISMNDKARGVA
jgi:hypothetical protein